MVIESLPVKLDTKSKIELINDVAVIIVINLIKFIPFLIESGFIDSRPVINSFKLIMKLDNAFPNIGKAVNATDAAPPRIPPIKLPIALPIFSSTDAAVSRIPFRFFISANLLIAYKINVNSPTKVNNATAAGIANGINKLDSINCNIIELIHFNESSKFTKKLGSMFLTSFTILVKNSTINFITDLSTFSNTVAIKSNTVEINNLGIYKASVFVITITKSNILAITNGTYAIN